MLLLFTGGRGSGKSSIAKELYKKLNEINFDYIHQSTWREQIKNLYQKLFCILFFLFFFRLNICKVFIYRLYRDLRYSRAKWSFARIYMPCVYSYHLQRLSQKKESCVVYDSDFLTWSADKALDGKFNSREVIEYYKQVILPLVGDLIIIMCDTPVKDAVERWQIRDNKILSENEKFKWIMSRTGWKKARQEVVDLISKIPGIRVIYLNGLDTPDKNALRIISVLKELSYRDKEFI